MFDIKTLSLMAFIGRRISNQKNSGPSNSRATILMQEERSTTFLPLIDISYGVISICILPFKRQLLDVLAVVSAAYAYQFCAQVIMNIGKKVL